MVRIDMSEFMEQHSVVAADRRAAGLRRLRRRGPADRSRPPPALLRAAARRNRKSPPRRVQRPAAGARRRPADRQPRPHGRFHATRIVVMTSNIGSQAIMELAGKKDEKRDPQAGDRRPAAAFSAGVPEPHRRDDRLPSAGTRRDPPDRRSATRTPEEAAGRERVRSRSHRRREDLLAEEGYDPVYGAGP